MDAAFSDGRSASPGGAPPAPAAHRERLPFGRAIALTAAASLVVGLIVGPIVSGRPTLAQDTTTAAEHTVTATGTGRVSIAPDVADVILGVSIEKTTAKAARDAAATTMGAVLTAVKKHNVAAKDIVTVGLSVDAVYDYSNNKTPRITGYRFGNTIRVTVRDLSALPGVIDDAINAGANNVGGVAFRVSDPAAAQKQARQLAMADARAKADALASAASVSIKGVATIAEAGSNVQPQPVYAAAGALRADAAASTPIQTGTTDIEVNVTVSYLIG